MSRIFDALQRADLEQKAAKESDNTATAEPFAAPVAEDLLPVKDGIAIDQIAMRSWNPSAASLPTLCDRGESIEQFRSLRTQVYQFRDQAPLKTILVSSGVPAEGKSFVVANLAMSLARNKDNTVLLIDADMRSPSLHKTLGAANTPGLAEYLSGTAAANSILQRNKTSPIVEDGIVHGIPNLTFIPAGAGGDHSSELVANHRIEELIALLSPHFDWILIDSPPVLAVADAIDLSRAADAVILVARGASTSFDVARRAQAAFINSRVLGFVLNAVKDAPHNSSYYYYYGKHDSGTGLHGSRD
jgi:capsular exopolysaccharide synthesis family protein